MGKTFGIMGVDWEERLDYGRMRGERLERARAALRRSELGALVCFDYANIRYISSTHIGTMLEIDKMIRWCVLTRDGDPVIWDFGSAVRHHHLYAPWLGDRARAGLTTFRGAIPEGVGQSEDVAKKIRRVLDELELADLPVGVDICEPPVLFALQREGLEVRDGQPVMLEARKVKTRDEIVLLDTACSMVDAAYAHLYTTMGPGLRENECVGLVTKDLFDMGSEHVEGVNAISGERANPHPHVFSDRILRPGDPAYFDIIHAFNGYRTCYYRTFAIGSASPAFVDAYKRCRDYLDQALSVIRAGVSTADVAECFPRAVEFGFPNEEAAFALQMGHGVGLSVWERPLISRLIPREHAEILEEGTCIAVETFWPATDGVRAARIEEQVIVTKDGCDVLTRFPGEQLLVAGPQLFTVGGPLPWLREVESHKNTERAASDNE